jgi:outer membrane protein TolC
MDAEWSRLNSAREAVRLAQLQLNAEERNLEVGLNTVWDVIEAQDRLAEALDAEGKSMALYAAARSRLQADQARSFEVYKLVVAP